MSSSFWWPMFMEEEKEDDLPSSSSSTIRCSYETLNKTLAAMKTGQRHSQHSRQRILIDVGAKEEGGDMMKVK